MNTMQATEALAGIIDAMSADSYDVVVEGATSDELSVSIAARDGACEDCLAPPSIMTTVISTALDGRYRPEQIKIAYPNDSRHDA